MPNDRLLVMLDMLEDLLVRIRGEVEGTEDGEMPQADDPDAAYAAYVANATAGTTPAAPAEATTNTPPASGGPNFLANLRVPAGRPLSKPEDEQ